MVAKWSRCSKLWHTTFPRAILDLVILTLYSGPAEHPSVTLWAGTFVSEAEWTLTGTHYSRLGVQNPDEVQALTRSNEFICRLKTCDVPGFSRIRFSGPLELLYQESKKSRTNLGKPYG